MTGNTKGLNMTKKTTTTIAILVLALAGLFMTNPEPAKGGTVVPLFTDVPASHTFFGDIYWLAEEGITTGCTPTKFCPEDNVTRGEMAAFITRAFGLDRRVVYNYVDVPTNHTFRWNIGALTEEGITTGCDTSPLKYCPEDNVTRGQMMAFLNRAFGWDRRVLVRYNDVPPGHVFQFDIGAASEMGVTTGCGGGNFCPNDPVTRGQMAAFLHRGFEG